MDAEKLDHRAQVEAMLDNWTECADRSRQSHAIESACAMRMRVIIESVEQAIAGTGEDTYEEMRARVSRALRNARTARETVVREAEYHAASARTMSGAIRDARSLLERIDVDAASR